MTAIAAAPAPRLDLDLLAPRAEKALGTLDAYVDTLGLEPDLLDLVRMRASQLNGCVVCLVMHGRDLRARGDKEHRLHALDAWHEAPFYTPRERAALRWTEAVTRVAESRVDDATYHAVREQLDEREIAALTLAIVAINSWNRLAIALRMTPAMDAP